MEENELFDLVFGADECISEDGVKQKLCEPNAIAGLFNFKGRRRIEQLTADGVIDAVIVTADGRKVRRYDLIPTIQKYVKVLYDKAHGKALSEREIELKEQKLAAEVGPKRARANCTGLKHRLRLGSIFPLMR